MEVSVKHTIVLEANTLAVLTALIGGKTVREPYGKGSTSAEVSAPVAEPKEEAKAEKKATTKAGSTKKAEEKPAEFEDLEDDAKLSAIQTEVTKHTKKGKSADIRALLKHFDAGRASELSTEVYNDFYQAIKRYGAGESVDAITGGEDLA